MVVVMHRIGHGLERSTRVRKEAKTTIAVHDADEDMIDPLEAVSPLDGRYAGVTRPLRPYASESALMRARVQVEVEYLIALSELDEFDLEFDDDELTHLREMYRSFELSDARSIKIIETEGDEHRPATNHDVKAVEYWVRDELEGLGREDCIPLVHFGLTSEDVNNLAYRLLISEATSTVLMPALEEILEMLRDLAHDHQGLPMLARTHGQAASPTTFGKEMGVFVGRIDRILTDLEMALNGLHGKFGGATGTYAAHHMAEPEVDWPKFARSFVEEFDLEYLPLTTQVNPSDDLARVFDVLARVNTVLIDLDRDMWRYISDGYLVQQQAEGEVGSSTMPHKVNPIDFENSEGNLSKARSDLRFLAEYLPESRLQRDLSDSTVKRTIGSALAHALLGYEKTATGLEKVVPNPSAMERDLTQNHAVLAEAFQTALRRIGDETAYERLKNLTRGGEPNLDDFAPLIEEIREVDPTLAKRLDDLSPAGYTGLANELVERFDTS